VMARAIRPWHHSKGPEAISHNRWSDPNDPDPSAQQRFTLGAFSIV
jgi:hypothetical protein